jgi:hypothetical protein
MSTIANTIAVAKVTSYLASDYLAKRQLFGGSVRVEPRFPLMITTERIIIEKIYNWNPDYPNLQIAADYVYDLCGRWKTQAQAIVDGGGGGGTITPVTPGSSVFPLYITSADFADATNYNNPDIVGVPVMIFVNEYSQQWVIAGDNTFKYTGTGISITLPGFDAITYQYSIVIQKLGSG